MDVLGTIAPTGGFITALVAMAWLVYTGKLVPRSVLDDQRADHAVAMAAERADKEHWRQVAVTSSAQVSELLTTARVTAQVLQALPASTQSPEGAP